MNAAPRTRARSGSINFARLNYILIPETNEARDRFRTSAVGRLVRPLGWIYGALSAEGRVLAVASLVIGGLGLDVQNTDAHVAWAVVFALLVTSVAARSLFRLDGARLEVTAPRRVSVGETATVSLALHNDADAPRRAVRVVGPFLPWDGRFVGEPPRFATIRANAVARGEVGVAFSERGEHHLDTFHAGVLVPFGLALGPRIASASSKILVVPRIANVARLTTARGSRHQPGGVPLASRTGESMDLLGVRPYRPGDPVRHLHARSWARAGIPVVREYQEEYFSRVGVVVDTSAIDAPRFEAVLSIAAGVVAFLTRGEGLVDLLVVGGRVHDLTLGRHLGFLEQALDLLACVRPDAEPVTPDALVRSLARHIGRLSAVVVVTGAWDEGALGERVRGFGVACSTVVVARDGDGVRAGRDAVVVDADAAMRGEALAL